MSDPTVEPAPGEPAPGEPVPGEPVPEEEAGPALGEPIYPANDPSLAAAREGVAAADAGEGANAPPEEVPGGAADAAVEPGTDAAAGADTVDEYSTGGGWYEMPDGTKVQGRDAAAEYLAEHPA